jgi:hypothetical protein
MGETYKGREIHVVCDEVVEGGFKAVAVSIPPVRVGGDIPSYEGRGKDRRHARDAAVIAARRAIDQLQMTRSVVLSDAERQLVLELLAEKLAQRELSDAGRRQLEVLCARLQ